MAQKALPLTAAQIATAIRDYAAGDSIMDAAARQGISYTRLQRALRVCPDFTPRTPKEWSAAYPGRRKRPAPFFRKVGPYAASVLRHAQSGEATVRAHAAVAERLHALRAQARVGGPLLCGPLQVAAAHAAGLTLDDIAEVFAVPPREAARAIAAHAGR